MKHQEQGICYQELLDVIADNVKMIRRSLGMTVELFSGFMNISKITVHSLEHGEQASLKTLYKISSKMGIPLSDLFKRHEKELCDLGPEGHPLIEFDVANVHTVINDFTTEATEILIRLANEHIFYVEAPIKCEKLRKLYMQSLAAAIRQFANCKDAALSSAIDVFYQNLLKKTGQV